MRNLRLPLMHFPPSEGGLTEHTSRRHYTESVLNSCSPGFYYHKKFLLFVILLSFLILTNTKVRGEDLMSYEVRKNIKILIETNSCVNCNLEGANLNRAELAYANLEGAKLNNSLFILSNLANANFKNCNLLGAEFGGADISGADFTGANLTTTSFVGTYRKNAIFVRKNQSTGQLKEKSNLDKEGVNESGRVPSGEKSGVSETNKPVSSTGPVKKKLRFVSPVLIK